MASTPPKNFSWVDPGKVAGLALPRMTAEYQYLLDQGIQHLVCLCECKPPNYDTCPKLQLHYIKINDFTPPSPSQIDKFLAIVDEANSKGEGVAVHCMHGHGRTGTMLACYLVKTRKMAGIDAINEIRRLRSGSIETHDQEKAVGWTGRQCRKTGTMLDCGERRIGVRSERPGHGDVDADGLDGRCRRGLL